MARRVRKKAPCRRCMTIRFFLMCALPIIGIMAFFPKVAAGLGPNLPPPQVIAIAIPMIAIPVFVIRVVNWHRAGRPMW